MRGNIGLLHALRATDVGLRLCHADKGGTHGLNVAAARRYRAGTLQ